MNQSADSTLFGSHLIDQWRRREEEDADHNPATPSYTLRAVNLVGDAQPVGERSRSQALLSGVTFSSKARALFLPPTTTGGAEVVIEDFDQFVVRRRVNGEAAGDADYYLVHPAFTPERHDDPETGLPSHWQLFMESEENPPQVILDSMPGATAEDEDLLPLHLYDSTEEFFAPDEGEWTADPETRTGGDEDVVTLPGGVRDNTTPIVSATWVPGGIALAGTHYVISDGVIAWLPGHQPVVHTIDGMDYADYFRVTWYAA